MYQRIKSDYLAFVVASLSIVSGCTQSAWSDTLSTTSSTSVTGAGQQSDIVAPAALPTVPTTVTTTTTTSSNSLLPGQPQLRTQPIQQSVQRSIELKDADLQPERIRKDKKLASRLAKSHWLEKAVAEDPDIIAAITQYSGPAKTLAKHPRLGHIAEYDHYLCRQLTKWKGASRALARNPQAQAVLYYDPEGIYRAIRVDKSTAEYLAHNTEFAQMVIDNPDLAKVLASYM